MHLNIQSLSIIIFFRLLKRHTETRLGASADDADEIKNHPFFRQMDWEKVYRREVGIFKIFKV